MFGVMGGIIMLISSVSDHRGGGKIADVKNAARPARRIAALMEKVVTSHFLQMGFL